MTAPVGSDQNIVSALTKLALGQQNLTAAVRSLAPAATTNGRAILVAGTVTVTTAAIKAASNVRLSKVVGAGAARGILELGTVVAGTSFVINARQTGGGIETNDTSTVYWEIV